MSHAENEKDMQREINELKKKYAAHGGGKHHLNLSLLLGIQRMTRIGKDPELRLVKPSSMMRSTVVIGGRAKVHCIRV